MFYKNRLINTLIQLLNQYYLLKRLSTSDVNTTAVPTPNCVHCITCLKMLTEVFH